MAHGKTITIFWVDGTPDGIITGELSGWNGMCVKLPRDQINSKREELEYPGVYFLICTDTEDGEDAVYIGESDNLRTRLNQHIANYKMGNESYYWQSVVAFSSNSLNKALVKYLENRLVMIAKDSKRYKVLTKATSPKMHLKEHEIDSMEQFIENIKTLLTALNYRILEELPQKAELKESASNTTRTMLYISTKETSGSGYLTPDDKFVLCKGSTIKAHPSKACAKAALKKRENLIEDGVIVDNTLMDDVLVSSSSLAASLITGFSTSGPEWWKTKDGISLKELQMKE